MAGVKALICLAFSGSIGLLFLVLGCALPSFNSWWPLFVLVFYVLSPIPLMISNCREPDFMGTSSADHEFALFCTTGIVVSAFALPIVLAHSGGPVIHWGACALVTGGNIVSFLTILAYFFAFREDDFGYSMW